MPYLFFVCAIIFNSLSPSFENIEMVDITTKDTDETESNYDEDFHLSNVLP
jgi:hypothetical protein